MNTDARLGCPKYELGQQDWLTEGFGAQRRPGALAKSHGDSEIQFFSLLCLLMISSLGLTSPGGQSAGLPRLGHPLEALAWGAGDAGDKDKPNKSLGQELLRECLNEPQRMQTNDSGHAHTAESPNLTMGLLPKRCGQLQ
ncbi:hypothetical protein BDW62DRAFT_46337 [Aspergillus aurantiobrunneus]